MEYPLGIPPIPDGHKRCGACGKIKPATPNFFYASRTIKSGLQNRCIACIRKPKPNIPEGCKRCTTCQRDLPADLDHFGSDKRKKDGLRQPCRECRNKLERQDRQEYHEEYLRYEKDYREENRERIKANEHRYEQSAKGRQNATNRMRRYRAANPEHMRLMYRAYYWSHVERALAANRSYRERHPERMRYLRQRWMKAHPEYNRAALARRRAHLIAAGPGTYTPQDVQLQYTRQKGQCYYCHKKVKSFHVDHVIPLSRGGSNGPENIVIACQSCNNRKYNKLPHEWPDGGRLL